MKNTFVKIFFAVILTFTTCLGKTNIDNSGNNVINELIQLTHSTFGANYSVNGYEILDSVLTRDATRDFNYNPYTDPYGTLRHCIVLWVTKERSDSFYANEDNNSNDTSIVCIVRNDHIVWNSGSQIIGDVDSLLFCFDLNNSGRVDIGLLVHEFQKENFSLLYIISWNGREGEFISDVDQSGRSVIVTSSDIFEIFDLNNDGNYEIRGCWAQEGEPGSGWFPANNLSSTAPYVTYSWNGSKYSFGPGTEQVAGYEFLPANRIKLLAHCNVEIENGMFKYSYTFKNDIASKQLIDEIYIEDIDSTVTTAFGPWTGNYSWILNSYHWTPLSLNRNQMLKAREEKDGFGFLSSQLPVIKNLYAQGFAPLGDVASNERTDDAIINDVKTNSYITKTIGPGSSPSPLIPTDFLDTLISYKHQCVSLGWLTNGGTQRKDKDSIHRKGKDDNTEEGIVERLDRRLDKAKDALSKNDSVKARLELELFVKEVEHLYHQNKEEGKREGLPVLTSEGYALLKYNAEYLIDRLPGKEKGKTKDE
ncbi:MAG: hypothetical protein ACYCVH_04830 [Ignavibacteriaceae bacterium]